VLSLFKQLIQKAENIQELIHSFLLPYVIFFVQQKKVSEG
jgi:hypothetical protein